MRKRLLILFSALCLACSIPAWAAGPHSSIYQLSGLWKNQDGKKISLHQFQGKPLVLAMIYTSCTDTCPLIVADMRKIEEFLAPTASGQTRFALFSFDTKRDKPAKLKRYASAHGLDLKRWTLLTGPGKSVNELADALGVTYKKLRNGGFSHSDVITILDTRGIIRDQEVGTKNDPGRPASIIAGFLNP